MTIPMPLDKNGYGTHAGRRQLGLDALKPHYAPQACGGEVTADCYKICLRKCYPPGDQPMAPFISADNHRKVFPDGCGYDCGYDWCPGVNGA